MGLTMVSLLVNSQAVPPDVRERLKVALQGPQEHRQARLESAARALYRSTGLECEEARDLLGLEGGTCG